MKYPVLILTFIILLSQTAKAQFYNYETKEDAALVQQRMELNRQRIIDNRISSVKVYSYKPGADAGAGGYLSLEFQYDSNGDVTDYKVFNKRGSLKYNYAYKWND